MRIKPIAIPLTGEDDYYAEAQDNGVVVINTNACNTLSPMQMKYILLHEYTHTISTMQHDQYFYDTLRNTLSQHNWSDWSIAREMEQIYPEWMF